jgi:hypothetical protein
MKKTLLLSILIACFYISRAQDGAQKINQTIVFKSDYYTLSKYDKIKKGYEIFSDSDCDIYIFYSSSKIDVKNKENSVFYIQKVYDEEIVNGTTVQMYGCYDKDGNDCNVSLIINSKTVALSITYKGSYRVTYFLKIEKL